MIQVVHLAFAVIFIASFPVNSFRFGSRAARGQIKYLENAVIRHTIKPLLAATTSILPEPFPGSPVVKSINKDENVAYMKIALNGAQTQKAFNEACDIFNGEVKKRDLRVPGFRPGAKLPPAYLYQIFGEDQVKSMCASLLSEEIQDECERTGLMFVGRGRITNFYEASFTAGKPHSLDIECDLWPTITYGDKGYKGLSITVSKPQVDQEKLNQVKNSIRERYKVLGDTEAGYAAKLGDVVVANMKGYEKTASGQKGAQLPAIAAGDSLEIVLEKGKFMEGMVEGLVGARAGDVREITVTFPKRDKGPGAALSEKQAIFEVEVKGVKTMSLPAWDEQLAKSIRDDMTLEALNQEVVSAIEGDSNANVENARNDAISAALLQIVHIDKLPDSIMEENTQQRFQQMLMDFKAEGTEDAQLEEMSTPENYQKYKDLSRPNVEKIVKLSLAFRDIIDKEKLSVTKEEIAQQYNLLVAQARQKNEPIPEEGRATNEIENVLLRKKAFDLLASTANITWIEESAPTQ